MRTIKQYEIYKSEKAIPMLDVVHEFDGNIHPCIAEGRDIYGWMIMMRELYKIEKYEAEHIYVIAIDSDGYVIGTYLLGIGDPECVNFDQRNLGIFLLLIGATDFIIVHNHPNDVLFGSESDKLSSHTYEAVGRIIGIRFLGFYAVGESGFINVNDEKHISWEDEKILNMEEVLCV